MIYKTIISQLFYYTFCIFRMLGTDDNKLIDEMLSNTSSPCGSDSPTCFIRQSIFKTKESFTQYPCLGKIYLINHNFEYLGTYISEHLILGPFLEALFSKLENMPDQDFRINLHLTAVMTRLSIYNKPLIQSLLLNHSIIFQPCIRSLFQVSKICNTIILYHRSII